MKKTTLTITLPKPCSEDWESMSIVDRGRFCASCQKNVVDFTRLTDSEVIAIFKAAKDNPPCGRFDISQLDRELTEAKNSPFSTVLLKRIAASFLFFQAIVTTAWAQTAKPRTTQQSAHPTDNKKQLHSRVINGKVIDFNTGEKLFGIIVKISGTEAKAMTDAAGRFHLVIPHTFTASKFTLVATYSDKAIKEPSGTEIFKKEVDISSPEVKAGIVLYRYPKSEPQKVEVVDNTAYLPQRLYQQQGGADFSFRSGARSTGTQYIIDGVAEPRKRNFWQRITSPFRKKKNSSDQ